MVRPIPFKSKVSLNMRILLQEYEKTALQVNLAWVKAKLIELGQQSNIHLKITCKPHVPFPCQEPVPRQDLHAGI